MIDNPVVLHLPQPHISNGVPLRHRWQAVHLCTAPQLERVPVAEKVLMPVQLKVQLEAAHLQVLGVHVDVLLVVHVWIIGVPALPVNKPRNAGRGTGPVRGAVRRHPIAVLVKVGQSRN